MTAGEGNVVAIDSIDALASIPALEVGARVIVTSTRESFYCTGFTTQQIADHLGWTQSNVWVPDHAKNRMERRHRAFTDHLHAIEVVLLNPVSVREDPEEASNVRFVAEANVLRDMGLLTSRSMTHVDVLIELRLAVTETYLRAFHLSPMRQPQKGRQRWP